MLEQMCRRCWKSELVLRPTMHDIVGDLRPETWFLQNTQSSKQLVHDDEISDLEKAL